MIKVLLVEDHPIYRKGIQDILESDKDIVIIGETESGLEAIRLADELLPDIILMDISIKDLDGIKASKKIMLHHSEIKIVVLSMYSGFDDVNNALKAGVKGYLSKECASEDLISAIYSVMKGEMYFPRNIMETIARNYAQNMQGGVIVGSLTPMEIKVLKLLVDGKDTKDIADILNVSIRTVGTHRFQIMKKLDVKNITELIKLAYEHGLV